ncbi:MAG: molybdenum cofactor biosynthesis protein MoaE [Nitrososphaerota archaeon]|nr:molybdenum cofactor biosynthesis protein MoaE [Candidatus Bathyarchaeota archaeon]MDW8048830.1 molybdenum cofactor biosynthesis protein MoaE [Nitrososphaerota archaeon]
MRVKVSDKLDELIDLIGSLRRTSEEIGAIMVFIGIVRGSANGEKVRHLEYEAHEELAAEALQRIIGDLREKYGIIDAVLEHRVGVVGVGGDIMYAIVASKHREEGFKALTEMVERVKREVPIWKKEVRETGPCWVENITEERDSCV